MQSINIQSSSELLASFLSNDNNTRKVAEAYLNTLHESDPIASFEVYRLGVDLERPDLAELAAILLKKKHIDKKEDLAKIPNDKVLGLVQKLQASFSTPNRTSNFLKRAAEILILIYTNQDAYLDLMKFIFSLTNSTDIKVKQVCMYFIEVLCDYSFDEELLMDFSKDLVSLFDQYLADTNIILKACTIKAVTIFLANIMDEKFIKNFSAVLPVILSTLIEAVKTDEDSGRSTIESLTDLVESHPKFIKPIVEDSIAIMSEIFETKAFSDALRSAALSCLLTLASTNDVVVRKSENFKSKAIPAIMKTMCDLPDQTLQEWNKETEEILISKMDPSSTAQDSLAKLSGSLGSKFMLMNCIPFIKEMITSTDWRPKAAGLMALGVLAEGSSKYFKNDLDTILSMVLPCFDHQEPRVLYSVLTCLALLCSEFTPTIQEKYHEILMQNDIKLMQCESSIRIQCRAVSFIMNFCQGLVENETHSNIITKYSENLLTLLLALFDRALKNNYYPLQEEALNAISMLAAVLGNDFAKYYNTLMPGLKQLLNNLPSETHQQTKIRALTIETMGFLAGAIRENPTPFFEDLENIMTTLVALHTSGKLEDDDQQNSAIINVYAQFASCLREKFIVFMPMIIDNVLKSLMIHVDFLAQDDIDNDNSSNKFKGLAQAIVDLKLYGGKKTLSLNTAALDLKMAASSAVYSLTKHLGKAYAPYVAKTFEILSQLFNYRYSKVVRRNVIKCLHNLVMCCDNETSMVEIMKIALPPLMEETAAYIKVSNDAETKFLLRNMTKSLKYLTTPNLPEEIVVTLCKLMGELIQMCEHMKKEVMNNFGDLDDCDEDKQEELKGEYEEVNDLMQGVMDLTGVLLKLYKNNIENLVITNIAPYYFRTIKNKDATPNEILYCVCLADDIMENCSTEVFNKVVSEVTPIFLNLAQTTENLDILQSVVFGLGVIAARIDKNEFKSAKQDFITVLSMNIMHQNAYTEERVVSTECAIGALGKIAIYQGEPTDKVSQEALIKFLQLLPLKHEPEEAQNVHAMLLQEILNKNQMLMMDNTDVQALLMKAISDIKTVGVNNPEMEILDDKGKLLLSQIGA